MTFAVLFSLSACSSTSSDCPEPARGLTESCCLEHGADACGTGLFCGVFDGRTVPTCYAERTRDDKDSCTANIQCKSGSCNASAGACRTQASGGGTCSPDVGCVDTSDRVMICRHVNGTSEYGCALSRAARDEQCFDTTDCDTSNGLSCDTSSNRCVYANLGECKLAEECGTNACTNPPQLGYKTCVYFDRVYPTVPACGALACPSATCRQSCYRLDQFEPEVCFGLECEPFP